MELSLSTPSPEHAEFDELCAEVEEFGPLPAIAPAPIDTGQAGEEASFNGQILAGLVSPC